ncbi:MAG TPA: endonuclease/exonuclease/phosphatase family protein [Streptosporangiaceae bacterium]
MSYSAIAWGLLLAWAAAITLHYLLSGRTWLWALPEMVPPVAFAAVPLAVIVLAVLRPPLPAGGGHWTVPVLASVLLVAGGRWSGVTLRPRRRRPARAAATAVARAGSTARTGPPAAAPVVAFVWNTQFWDQGKDQESFHRFIRERAADVYFLQEYVYWAGREVPATGIEKLAALMPDHEVFTDAGLVTLVHRRLAPLRRPGIPGTALRVDISAGAAPIALYNIHLPAPLDPGKSPLKAPFYRFVRAQAARRRHAFQALDELLDEAPPALFMGGDFNSSPAMRGMRRLRGRLADALPPAGRPYPATWPAGRWRLWRIDWVFTSPQVVVESARIVEPAGLSDHAGQLCVIRPSPRMTDLQGSDLQVSDLHAERAVR